MHTQSAIKNTLAALLVTASLAAGTAWAGSVTLTLNRASLTNVDDPAGRWQHEGGQILKNGAVVGNYAAHRRVTFGGTDAQNTAMVTMTLFFNGQFPPQNITLQGSHDFSSGRYIGSVSAASSRYNWLQDANVSGNTGTNALTINWLEASQLSLP